MPYAAKCTQVHPGAAAAGCSGVPTPPKGGCGNPPGLHPAVRPGALRKRLSRQQRQFLRGLYAGYSRDEVATWLGMSPEHERTVLSKIREKGWAGDVPKERCGGRPLHDWAAYLPLYESLPHGTKCAALAERLNVSEKSVAVHMSRLRMRGTVSHD